MVKQTITYCNRCQQPISHADERVADFLEQEYPGQYICADCDLLIQLAASVSKNALIRNVSFKTVIEEGLERYGN